MAQQLGNHIVDIATNKVFVDLVTNFLKEKIKSYVSDQYNYQCGTISSMNNLESNLTRVQAVVAKAVVQQNNEQNFVAWLNELKDAIYEAEDVLDTFDYKRLEEEAQRNQKFDKMKDNDYSKMPKFLACDCDKLLKDGILFLKRLFYCDEDLNDLRKVVNKFDSFVREMPTFLQLAESSINVTPNLVHQMPDEVPEGRRKTAMPDELELYGRDKVKKEILKRLKENSNENELCYSIVSIVGIGGVGKTTLSQSIFNDESLVDYFHVKSWVCVSNNFTIRRIMIEIMQSASIDGPLDIHQQGLSSIENHLSKGLTGKRFLIVLDDVWETMNNNKWETLCKSFRSADKGSKILVTTRTQKVGKSLEAKYTEHLPPLEPISYHRLFLQCAFGKVNAAEYPKLYEIGLQIADKLGGLPLAAKTIGKILKSNLRESHWRNILESKAWTEDTEEIRVMATLKLSYDHLPPKLKQCFVYCSLFPRNHPFHIMELGSYWAAHGLVQENTNHETFFELVRKYVDELQTRSFLIPDRKNYVIHGLFHDLVTSIAGEEIYRVVDDNTMKTIPPRVRHLFVQHGNLDVILQNIPPKRLRSLIYYVPTENFLLTEANAKKLTCLRMLYIHSQYDSQDLGAISKLKHLRSLTIDSELPTSVSTEYPETICELYQLKTLLIPYGQFKGLHKLVNLQAVILSDVGKPALYQILSPKELGSYVDIKETGSKLSDLQNLNKIDGDLHLQIKSSVSKEEAKQAVLIEKKDIEKVCFKICGNDPLQDEAFEELQPHKNLKELQIFCSEEGLHKATKVPSWINREDLCNLKYVALLGCTNLETLPNLGQLPFLQVILLEKLPSLKMIGEEFYGEGDVLFPSMKMILLHWLQNLKHWFIPANNTKLFPNLLEVYIAKCDKLKGPINLPNPTKQFAIVVKEEEKTINATEEFQPEEEKLIKRFFEKIKEEDYKWKSMLTFTIQDISLFTGSHSENPPCLSLITKLEWQNLSDSHECLPRLSSLEELNISYSHIQSLPSNSLPTSLKKLTIKCCAKLRNLDCLTSLLSLEVLIIAFCPQIEKFPDFGSLKSLNKIRIISHDPELSKRQDSELRERPDGIYWIKNHPKWFTSFHIPVKIVNEEMYRWEKQLELRNVSHIHEIEIDGEVMPHQANSP